MNESGLLTVIQNIIGKDYIGDDCAFLKDLGIVVSQDSLVEDIHFKLNWMTPYELGIKSVLVNISDILASGAEPAYISISLSLPKTIDENFVKDFYLGAETVCKEYGAKVIGGDLTGSDKVYISICALGKTFGRNISSRSNAKAGYKVVVAGEHGSSAAGLLELKNGIKDSQFIKRHKHPVLQKEFATLAATSVKDNYAMMDTSDGLADALFKIATASNVTLEIDFEKIPFNKELQKFSNYKELILFGGEDYSLIGVVPNDSIIDSGTTIGYAVSAKSSPLIIRCTNDILEYNSIEEFTYNHF